eukprot:gb/GECH01013257.1/.p1 GENE.gb/GECH01013257.1/~~gb/GECH01013257.1/.p1  ORF type:complete len:186 (+),score=28.40 gb/GECH01013257.1/:1-558(+)
MTDDNLKVVVVGDGAVGKTCLLNTFTHDEFPENYTPTIFENFQKTMDTPTHGSITLSLWDTAGQEDYDRLRRLSYPKTDVFIVCFALDDVRSLENVKAVWVPEVKLYRPKTPFIIAGLKSDLRDPTNSRSVSTDLANRYAQTVGAVCCRECSAKSRQGVTQVFESAIQASMEENQSKEPKCCVIL